MPTDRDALNELAKYSRMNELHKITHYLYLPTQQAAREVMMALAARDFEAEEPHLMFDRSWGVLVRTRMVPEEEAIVALRSLFTEITSEYDGDYDGWEAEIPPSGVDPESHE